MGKFNKVVVQHIINSANVVGISNDDLNRYCGLSTQLLVDKSSQFYAIDDHVVRSLHLLSEAEFFHKFELAEMENRFGDSEQLAYRDQNIDMWMMALLNQKSLNHFLTIALNMVESQLRHVDMSLLYIGNKVRITHKYTTEEAGFNTAQSSFTGLTKLIRMCFPNLDFNPVYSFKERKIQDLDNFARLNTEKMLFGRQESSIEFEAKLLDTPNPSYNPNLELFIQKIKNELFSSPPTTNLIKNRVVDRFDYYFEHNPVNITFEKISSDLHMSASTLQRRLKSEGTTYKDTLEDYRKNKSMQILQSSSMSVAAISDQLGYSNSTSFNRAFKRWYGYSPTHLKTKG